MNVKAGHLDLKHEETISFYDRELEFLAKDKDGISYVGMLVHQDKYKCDWLLFRANQEEYNNLYSESLGIESMLNARNEIMKKAMPDFWALTEPSGEGEMTIVKYTQEQLDKFIEEFGSPRRD